MIIRAQTCCFIFYYKISRLYTLLLAIAFITNCGIDPLTSISAI